MKKLPTQWVSAETTVFNIKDMSSEYIRNCIKMCLNILSLRKEAQMKYPHIGNEEKYVKAFLDELQRRSWVNRDSGRGLR